MLSPAEARAAALQVYEEVCLCFRDHNCRQYPAWCTGTSKKIKDQLISSYRCMQMGDVVDNCY